MKIGYPCINLSIGCKGDRTFRLKSYSEERLIETVGNNLGCLRKMLVFNFQHNILFFRITSDLVPFASHPICKFDWQGHFKARIRDIGEYVKIHNLRISMHPDQFTLINSLDLGIFDNSVRELLYHAQVLDLMKLDASAKIQIHVGGVYEDKKTSITRFVKRVDQLDEPIRKRLVIENDDRLYNLGDCIRISTETGIPVLFDVFHHRVNSSGESIRRAFELFTETWRQKDGIPMVDYSSPTKTKGQGRKHAESINVRDFNKFLKDTRPFDFDLMLEIKDKERSALKAVETAAIDDRFIKANVG